MRDVEYVGAGTADFRGPSPALWCETDFAAWLRGEGGIADHDDFINTPILSTSANTGKYACFADTSCTITQVDERWGAVKFLFDGTAADATAIQYGGNSGSFVQIDTSVRRCVAFECRIKKSSIATNDAGFFVGLADEGQAADNTLVDTTHALEASSNFLGFHCAAGTSGAIVNFVHAAAAGSAVTLLASAATMVADTWIKLGFLYMPGNRVDASKRLKIFVDGVEQSTYGTNATCALATFPSAVNLAPLAYFKNGSGSNAQTAHMDFWRFGHGDRV
jgi:hypothetical protein